MIRAARKTTKLLRAGIVGCGRIASLFAEDPKRNYVSTHAQAYLRTKAMKLVAACDLDSDRLNKFGETWKVENLYQDFDRMLESADLDILSICTWPQTHYDLARKAVEAGIKTIFCEKPLTTNLADADKMVELCREKGVKLAVNHSRRWDEGHQKLARLLARQGLGRVQQVSCYYTAGLVNTGTHLLDLLLLFLGKPCWVWTASGGHIEGQDPTLTATIGFENHVTVSLQALDVKAYLIFEIDIYGTQGRLRIEDSGFRYSQWRHGNSPYFSGYKELKPVKRSTKLAGDRMMINAIQNLRDAIKQGKSIQSTGEDGRNVLELVAALLQSRLSGRVVELPLKERNVNIL